MWKVDNICNCRRLRCRQLRCRQKRLVPKWSQVAAFENVKKKVFRLIAKPRAHQDLEISVGIRSPDMYVF
jgi:hypothetical protein